MLSATVAQNPTMPVSDGTKKRKNSPVVWNLLGALEHRSEAAGLPGDPPQQQQPDAQHERRADAFQKLDGLDAAQDHRDVERPEREEADPDAAGHVNRARPQNPEHGVDGLAADPGLDAEPPARHQRAQHRRNIGAAHSERRAHEHRKRNAVLRAGVRVQQHRDQHDQVAEQDGDDGLPPAHAARDQPRGQHVSGNAYRHRHPQRNVVVSPHVRRAWRNGSEILVVERGS